MILPKPFLYLLLILSGLHSGCIKGQSSNYDLEPSVFAERVKDEPTGILIDVRTPEEFGSGHIKNALNINWNDDGFLSRFSSIDTSATLFVYCLGGSRSSSAAKALRANGYRKVYELKGGITNWRSAGLPEANSISANHGLTLEQFNHLINSDMTVLVDFYADWCAPCKKMKPYLDEIETDMKGKVKVIRINSEENRTLCESLKIDAIPVLRLYKSNQLTWTHNGYITREELKEAVLN